MKPTRECGDCQACCVRLSIEPCRGLPLGKLRNEPCTYLGVRGCSKYEEDDYPQTCREFICGYLMGIVNERPDQVGLLVWVDVKTDIRGVAVRILETRPNAALEHRETLDYWLSYLKPVVSITKHDDSRTVHFHQGQPLTRSTRPQSLHRGKFRQRPPMRLPRNP